MRKVGTLRNMWATGAAIYFLPKKSKVLLMGWLAVNGKLELVRRKELVEDARGRI